jgi:hypothetical protein
MIMVSGTKTAGKINEIAATVKTIFTESQFLKLKLKK